MKTRTLLIAAAMFLALSAVAFSQVAVYSVSSTPITTVIATGNAEPAGDITFTHQGGTTVLGTISIQYGGNNVNITQTFANITIGCTGNYINTATTPASCFPTVLATSSIYSPGLLVISVPANIAGPGTFTISGVRVQINGAGLTNLVANISATGNQIQAGSTNVTVINSTTGAGIAPGSVATYNSAPAIDVVNAKTGNTIINGVTGNTVGTSGLVTTIKITEGFLAAWSKNVGMRITVTATPPKGVTFTFPNSASSYDSNNSANTVNSWVRGNSTSTSAQTSTAKISSSSTSSSSLQLYYYVATDIGATIIENLEIPVTIAVDQATASNFPLAAGIFNVNFLGSDPGTVRYGYE